MIATLICKTQIHTEKHWSRLTPGAQFPGAIRFGPNSFVTSTRSSALLFALRFSAVLCCCNGALMSPKVLGFFLWTSLGWFLCGSFCLALERISCCCCISCACCWWVLTIRHFHKKKNCPERSSLPSQRRTTVLFYAECNMIEKPCSR